MSVSHQLHFIQRCRFALAYELGTLLIISPAFIKHWHELIGFDGKIMVLLIIAILWNSVFANIYDQLLKRTDNIDISPKTSRFLYTSCYLVGLTCISLPMIYILIPLKEPQHVVASFGYSVLVYLYAISSNSLYKKHMG